MLNKNILFIRTFPLTVKRTNKPLDVYSNLYWVPFAAFHEQLAILQRTATTAQVL
jgi:hypothetical protein